MNVCARAGAHTPALLVWTALLLVAGLAAAGCRCSGGTNVPPPCETTDAAPACKVDCTGDGAVACPQGYYCDQTLGMCNADCVFGGDISGCDKGEACSVIGRCVPANGDTDSGNCADVMLTTMPTTPTVIVLVDQSVSMDMPFDNGTRWTELRDALTDPTIGLIFTLESVVRFGLTLYSAMDGGAVCPMLTIVPPALNNAAAIDAVYQAAVPIEDTPTGESIDAVVTDLVPFPEPGPKIIIVATDGEPDTCAVLDPQNGQPEAVAAAMAAHAAGIDLYMVGIGLNSVSAGHLQDMANAGIGLPVGGALNAPYYEVGTQADLIAALSAIVGGVISCTLDLNGSIDVTMAGSGTVRLDGMTLTYGDPNGWMEVDADTIILNGDACTTLSDGGSHTVDATFPCGVIL